MTGRFLSAVTKTAKRTHVTRRLTAVANALLLATVIATGIGMVGRPTSAFASGGSGGGGVRVDAIKVSKAYYFDTGSYVELLIKAQSSDPTAHLDADLDHLRRMNELISAYGNRGTPLAAPADTGTPAVEPMRTVDSLAVNPSEDLAIVASHLSHRMPRLVRYLMDGLGTPDAQSADLMRYLLFDSAYTRALVDIGYRDAGARIDEIETFLAGASPGAVPAVRPARPSVPVVA